MSEREQIECTHHGRSWMASVCGHVVRNHGVPLGFVENSDDPQNKEGWCYACELVFLQEEDKTERFRAFNQHAVVCARCYDEIRARHDFDAGAPEGGSP